MEKYELVKDIGSGNFGVARLMRNKETKELVAMKYIDRGLKVPSLHFLPSFFSPQIIQLLHVNLPLHSKYHVFYCSNRIVAVRLYCCLLIYIYIYFILRLQIDENVAREIINHRSLRHPNIIRFKEVIDLCLIIKDDDQSMFDQYQWFWNQVMKLQVVLTPTHLAIVMEYAAGGELFERICNAGRFSEDEVWSLILTDSKDEICNVDGVDMCNWPHLSRFIFCWFCYRLGIFSSSLSQELAIVILW